MICFRKCSFVSLLILGACFAPKSFAANCVCSVYPMYPTSNGNWLHYALRKTGACQTEYPMAQYKAYKETPEDCGTSSESCGGCSALGDNLGKITDVALNDFSFSSAALPQYADVNTEENIRKFLTDNAAHKGFETPTAIEKDRIRVHYNAMKFSDPKVVAIPRSENGVTATIYAVLWKGTFDMTHWVYLGIEISDGEAHSPLTAAETNRGGTFAQDDDLVQYVIVKGILDVRLNQGDPHEFQIRLSDKRLNKQNEAFPRRYRN